MKLKNKRTGEVDDFIFEVIKNRIDLYRRVGHSDTKNTWHYNSLAELNEEWEDVEEPKAYWYIDDAGVMQVDQILSSKINMRKSIGNYFEKKEEAEKAVEKLNAWKRLKDKGFKITLTQDGRYKYLSADWGILLGDFSDVELIFGGGDD